MSKFRPQRTPTVEHIAVRIVEDSDPDPSDLEQDVSDDRRAAYERGVFSFGVRAMAKIDVIGSIQTIQSPGLWGIESDSDPSYFDEVGREEYDALVDILSALGIEDVPPYPGVR